MSVRDPALRLHGAAPLSRDVADVAPVLIWRSGPDGRYEWFNKFWLQFTGRTLSHEKGMGWIEGVHPDDRAQRLSIFKSAFDARRPFGSEYRLRHADGEYRWMLDNAQPYQRDGEFAGYVGSCTDITFLKAAQEHQNLVIGELNHRLKNTLAMVQSIARQSFKRGSVSSDCQQAFEERLEALAAAHNLLTRERWESAALDQVIEITLAPHCAVGTVATLSGPAVRLPSKMAISLALAIHELCTNAIKFGALSRSSGRIEIVWWIGQERPQPLLHLRWTESGGPPVRPPLQRGFGSRMLERALAEELHGTVQLSFPVSGLVCTIVAPLPFVPTLAGGH